VAAGGRPRGPGLLPGLRRPGGQRGRHHRHPPQNATAPHPARGAAPATGVHDHHVSPGRPHRRPACARPAAGLRPAAARPGRPAPLWGPAIAGRRHRPPRLAVLLEVGRPPRPPRRRHRRAARARLTDPALLELRGAVPPRRRDRRHRPGRHCLRPPPRRPHPQHQRRVAPPPARPARDRLATGVRLRDPAPPGRHLRQLPRPRRLRPCASRLRRGHLPPPGRAQGRHDPDNVFRLNHNIPPSTLGREAGAPKPASTRG